MMTTRCGVLVGGLLLMVGILATPAHAQFNVNVNIGQPPPVVVYSPPTMVLLPEAHTYVAVGVPYDIFFVGSRYYYFHGDHWFWGPGYGGPWTYVEVQSLPPGLRKFKVRELREFREREYKVYKVKGNNFGGTYFVAEDKGNPGNPGNPGRGRGRGNKH